MAISHDTADDVTKLNQAQLYANELWREGWLLMGMLYQIKPNLNGCFHQFAPVSSTFPSAALWIFYNPPHFSGSYGPGYSQSSIPCIPSWAFCGRHALHPSSSLPPQASSQSLSVWQPSLHHGSKFPGVTRPLLHTALICVLQQYTVCYTRSSCFHSSRI